MEQMIADLMMGTVVGGVIIVLGFVLGVLWSSRWD